MKPDVMDGVPEEEGYYFAYGNPLGSTKRFNDWHIVKVIKNTIFNGKEFTFAKEATSEHFMFDESVFDEFDWSEKIKPPEV